MEGGLSSPSFIKVALRQRLKFEGRGEGEEEYMEKRLLLLLLLLPLLLLPKELLRDMKA